MSEELKAENTNLKKQAEQHAAQINNLVAQLDAHKGMLNEQLQQGLALRTNVVLFQKHNQELNSKIDVLNKQVASLDQQLADATAKIAELGKKPE